jgi:hypothetical protein
MLHITQLGPRTDFFCHIEAGEEHLRLSHEFLWGILQGGPPMRKGM